MNIRNIPNYSIGYTSNAVKPGYESSPQECQTCKNRKYQDGSDENVSFKSASHISPASSGARVRAHEAEHVSNAYTKAAQNACSTKRGTRKISEFTVSKCAVTVKTERTVITYISNTLNN